MIHPSGEVAATISKIHQKEAEINRLLAAEKEASEKAIAAAREEARHLIETAVATGTHTGQAAFEQALADIDAKNETIIAAARQQAAEMRSIGQAQRETAVTAALALILGEHHAS